MGRWMEVSMVMGVGTYLGGKALEKIGWTPN